MSTDRQYGFVILCCDECGATFSLDQGDSFEKTWTEAKDEGWQARKDEGKRLHFCGQPCEPSE